MNKWTKVSANIVMTCVIIWLLIPLVATIIYSLFEDWTGIIPSGFTLQNYVTIFFQPEISRCNLSDHSSLYRSDSSYNYSCFACSFCSNYLFPKS